MTVPPVPMSSALDRVVRPRPRFVAAPDHQRADQLREIRRHYKLALEIQPVVDLVYPALVWG